MDGIILCIGEESGVPARLSPIIDHTFSLRPEVVGIFLLPQGAVTSCQKMEGENGKKGAELFSHASQDENVFEPPDFSGISKSEFIEQVKTHKIFLR